MLTSPKMCHELCYNLGPAMPYLGWSSYQKRLASLRSNKFEVNCYAMLAICLERMIFFYQKQKLKWSQPRLWRVGWERWLSTTGLRVWVRNSAGIQICFVGLFGNSSVMVNRCWWVLTRRDVDGFLPANLSCNGASMLLDVPFHVIPLLWPRGLLVIINNN